jgi:hypothetical protein
MTMAEWRLKVTNVLADLDTAIATQNQAQAEAQLLKLQRLVKWWRWWVKSKLDGNNGTTIGIEQEWAQIEAS